MLVHSGMYVRKFVATFFMVGLVLTALAACGQQSSSSSNTVTIGASLPMTGDYSADGQAMKQGYDLWAAAVNQRGGLLGRHVVLDIKDDQTKQDVATTLYTNMISNHDDLLFGSFGEELTKAGADVAKRNGYALVEGAGNSPWIFKQGLTNLFSVSLSAARSTTSFSNYILSLPRPAGKGPLTAYYSTSPDPFTQPQVDNARSLLEAGHVKTLGYDVFPAENIDYDGLAQKIVAAKPDVVVLGTEGQEDSVAIMKHFKQQNFNPLAILSTAGPDQGKQFTDPLGGVQAARDQIVPNGGWFASENSYQNSDFVKAYLAKYGGTADDISSDTVQGYSVGQVMEQAVNKAQSLDNTKLIQTLRTNSFDSLQGPVKFDSLGQNSTATAFLFQWQNGSLIPVFPADVAQANPELNHYFNLPPSPNYSN